MARKVSLGLGSGPAECDGLTVLDFLRKTEENRCPSPRALRIWKVVVRPLVDEGGGVEGGVSVRPLATQLCAKVSPFG